MRRSVLPCILLAAAIGVAYLLIAPDTQDFAAAVFRSDLYARAGFVVVNDAWYGGHHVPAYSLVMPPLGALLGPRVVATIAVVVAAGLFAAIVDRPYAQRGARIGALWFAGAVAAQLFTGRVTFLLGVPIALGAVLAAQRGRPRLALALAVATAATSPVDAAFLALAGVAWAIGDPERRRLGLGLAAAALIPVAILVTLFPEGGTEPFVPSAFWPALAVLAGFALLLPRRERVLRAGAILYGLAMIAAFVIPTAVGGNITRLAALTAGPIMACVLLPRYRIAVALAALPFLYWQLMPAVRDVVVTDGDPSTQAAYYAPLIGELERRSDGPIRVEVPFTRTHWEAAHLAPHVALARGWERQLDHKRNALFYDDTPLTGARYRAWLDSNAVSFVALPGVRLDESAHREADLLRAGAVPGLRPVWRNADWTLFAVDDPAPLGVTAMGPDGFTVRADRPGDTDVRIRWSPHWAVVSGAGCVAQTSDGFTRVSATRAGDVRVGVRVSPLRALPGRDGERCHDAVTGR